MVTEAKKNDIPDDDGKLIVAEAAGWKGTLSTEWAARQREWVGIALARPKRSVPLLSVPAPIKQLMTSRLVLFAAGFSASSALVNKNKKGTFCLGPTIRRFIGLSPET